MAYPKDIKDKLRKLFVFDNLSLEVASSQLKVPFATASRWKRDAKKDGDDWDKFRDAYVIAGGSIEDTARGMITQLIQQFNSTMDQLNEAKDIPAADKVKYLASLSDSFNKAIATSKRIMPTTTQLATALDVINTLTDFVKNKYPQHLPAFAEILEPFGRELERKYD